MRTSPGLLPRRAIVGGSAPAAFRTPGGPASAEPPADRPPAARAQTLPSTRRYRALRHGGIVRPANSSTSCRSSAKAALGDAADPRDDVPNSTIGGTGPDTPRRVPSYANAPGHDSDALEVGEGIRGGGDQLAFRIVSQRDAAWIGALFAAVDAKQ
ncbi:hypothetical protein ACFYW9_05160 [Streptomyces sp. NPDC002698]|uniref:hypothetical protein n=1 Tax=Streptomyces sp. NPDC002698 TaxID=3364660 RepID=UPI0036A879F6